jgi:hypothetical protein
LFKAGLWRNLETAEKGLAGREENMTNFLRKAGASGVIANVAEYMVMLFVALMTGVSTLRLLGILP